jgi:hypothetical protein
MPTFLSDPPQTVYLVLIGAALVTGAVFARRQDRKSLLPFGVALGLLLLVLLLDRVAESPREGAVRAVQEMVEAANHRNADALVSHVADTVEYKGADPPKPITREQLRGAESALRTFNVRVAVWDFSRDDVREIDENTVEIGFLAKGEVEGKPLPVYVRATFARQPDGRMRLTKFATFDAVQRTNQPVTIPSAPFSR